MQQNIAIRQTTGQDMPGVMAMLREAFGMDVGAKLVRRCRGTPARRHACHWRPGRAIHRSAYILFSTAPVTGAGRPVMAITRLRAWQGQYTTRSL